MDRSKSARLIVAADAVGCAATGTIVAASPAALRSIDPSLTSRPVVAAALFGTAAVLGLGLLDGEPSRQHLTSSAAVNAAWALACLSLLPRQKNRVGVALLSATAVLDAGAGCLQWALRPPRPKE